MFAVKPDSEWAMTNLASAVGPIGSRTVPAPREAPFALRPLHGDRRVGGDMPFIGALPRAIGARAGSAESRPWIFRDLPVTPRPCEPAPRGQELPAGRTVE